MSVDLFTEWRLKLTSAMTDSFVNESWMIETCSVFSENEQIIYQYWRCIVVLDSGRCHSLHLFTGVEFWSHKMHVSCYTLLVFSRKLFKTPRWYISEYLKPCHLNHWHLFYVFFLLMLIQECFIEFKISVVLILKSWLPFIHFFKWYLSDLMA